MSDAALSLTARIRSAGRELAPLARAGVRLLEHARGRPAAWIAGGLALAVGGLALLAARRAYDPALTVPVRRGTLTLRLVEAGVLRPAESATYRSPVLGRETEIVFLAPEGIRVNEGDLIARLDTTEVAQELARARQDLRQAEVDLQLAEIETREGVAAVQSAREGEGALSIEEARTRLRIAERKVERLRQDYESLKPLLERGFLTRDELDKSGFELEQAEAELALERRKAKVALEQTHPREAERATLQLAQKQAARENVRAKLAEARARVASLEQQLEACSVYARSGGLVVYEDYLGAGQRRKVRVGDRVTPSNGIVTIPGLSRMRVEASVREADVHRVRAGQPAAVRVEAFPEAALVAKVVHVGTLARSSAERPGDEKRFELVAELEPSDLELRPDMSARVEVTVGERRDALLVPVNAVFDRGGAVCHVQGLLGSETRRVELGDSDDVFVEVRSGLQEGERVALLDAGAGAAPPPPPGAALQGLRSRLSGQPAGAPSLAPR
jgi:multidrug efflux pump subunit AcrA (membrane-fusion protein)